MRTHLLVHFKRAERKILFIYMFSFPSSSGYGLATISGSNSKSAILLLNNTVLNGRTIFAREDGKAKWEQARYDPEGLRHLVVRYP